MNRIKKVISVLFVVVILTATNIAGTAFADTFQWTTNEPYGGYINSLAMAPTHSGLVCLTASDDSPPISYYFQLAKNDTFSQGLQESGWQSSTTWSPVTLSFITPYFWRVKAKDSYGNETDCSTTFDFTTQTEGGEPQIEWLRWNGQITRTFTYEGGFLIMISDYAYFRNTGSPGTVEIEARIVRKDDGTVLSTRIDTFSIVSGQDYRLTIPITIVAWKDEYVYHSYDVSVSSSSATSNTSAPWYTEYYINTANINQIILEPYYNHPPDAPVSPLCEGLTNPTGVNDFTPEFSWTFSDPDSEYSQGAYRILVASTSENLALDIGNIWDSGKVSSGAHEAAYNGTALTGTQTYYWKVKTWDSQDAEGPYCAEQQFTTGTLLSEIWVDDDWEGSEYGDPVGGHTFGVDAFATIQEGINAVAGSTVYVAAGTYHENITLKDGVALLGAGAGVTIIDGGSGSTVSARDVGSATRLDGFTITHSTNYGSGMYNRDSSPTVTDCTFSGNSLGDNGKGGGMNNYKSSPTVTNCTFSGNSLGDYSYGGGMYNDDSSPTVTDCTFSGNSLGECGDGGGMCNIYHSSPTVTNCTFYGNSVGFDGYGGGIYNDDSSPIVTNCSFSGNSVGEYGDGGGMCNIYHSSPIVTNCTFYGNSAGYRGGGILDYNSTPTIINNIISNNTAGNSGGGIYTYESSSPIIDNNDVWNNSPDDYYGCSAGENDISENPQFVDPSANDYHLQTGSPCIDKGDNTVVPVWLTTDFEGDPRILDGDGDTTAVVDMGADEFFSAQIGDVNRDGNVNIADMTRVVRIILELDDETPVADVNEDGSINIFDMTKIARIILKLD